MVGLCRASCMYMSRSLSSLMFSIVHTVVPPGLCRVVCVCVCVCVCVYACALCVCVYVVWSVLRGRIGALNGCLINLD